jgi:hypothetical protein
MSLGRHYISVMTGAWIESQLNGRDHGDAIDVFCVIDESSEDFRSQREF